MKISPQLLGSSKFYTYIQTVTIDMIAIITDFPATMGAKCFCNPLRRRGDEVPLDFKMFSIP